MNNSKICFFLQRRFAYLGHAMALTFQKKYGINKFCGYVELRSSYEFLKSQKEIAYTKLLLDEEVHKQYKCEKIDSDYLNYLEKEYGMPNLWPYIESDRIIRYGQHVREYPHDKPKYTHEEIMRILQVKAKAIIKFLEEEKPDVVIFSAAVIGADCLLLYQIAKNKKIKVFVIQPARVGAAYTITEDYRFGSLSYVEKTYDELQKNNNLYPELIQKAEKFLEEFRNKPAPRTVLDSPETRPVTRKKQFGFLNPKKMPESIIWLFKIFYEYLSDKNRNDFSNIKPWHHILDRIKRKIRVLIGFGDLYDEINLNEGFAFYPLHVEPEANVVLSAPFYGDQLWLVKQIARSLPINYKLYVKEHPAMFGYRPRKYYKELKKIPNLKLIRPTIMSFGLLQNAKLIITLSGTAGLEAAFFKKPVITFGKNFYNKLPMVKKCDAIDALPFLVKEQLENFAHNEKALVNLVAAIYKESADVDMPQLWNIEGGGKMEKKEKELAPLVDLMANKLKIQPV